MPEGLIQKFVSKFVGSFLIVERVFKNEYKLELLPQIKVHSTKVIERRHFVPNCKQV
jgi:hypothetical protein